jgi:peptide-methionine (R)-S-oxide reductase
MTDLSLECREIGRRKLLGGCAAAAIAMTVWPARGVFADTAAATVTIVPFTAAGERQPAQTVPKVVMTEDEWKAKLSPASFIVARQAGTERPFSGELLNEHRKGIFRCIGCDTALFDSTTKFESGTGWPSFWQPIAKENVVEKADNSLGMERTEVLCTRCDGHLGHVFDDGPQPTGLRYCMNSVSLHFVPAVSA